MEQRWGAFCESHHHRVRPDPEPGRHIRSAAWIHGFRPGAPRSPAAGPPPSAARGDRRAAVAVVFLGWCLLHSSLFSARAITVVGATHETPAEIEAAAGLAVHPPLLDIQTGAEARGSRSALGPIGSVSVHWPDGVRVVVSERVPQPW